MERASVEIIQPVLDPLFDERNFGFRPGRDRRHALALAESLTVGEGRTVWVLGDVRDAFDRVPLMRLLDLVRHYLPADDLVAFLARLIANGSRRGLRQGGPVSPLLLNLYLHHNLDRRWRELHPDIPLIRVADDLLVLCQTEREGEQASTDLVRIVRDAKLELKDADNPVRSLHARDTVEWLGFAIRNGTGALDVRIPAQAWDRLSEYLRLAHAKPKSALRAVATIRGWVVQQGPCLRDKIFKSAYERIVSIAREQAFDEIPSRTALKYTWHEARIRWLAIRDGKHSSPDGSSTEGTLAGRTSPDLARTERPPDGVPFEPVVADGAPVDPTRVARIAELRSTVTRPPGKMV